jgi:hypothetical protein
MRKLLLLFSALLTLYAHGQTSVYRPFPTIYGNWVYQYFDDFHNPTSQFTQYTLNGDTIFSSINYKKIFVYSNYVGALRENNKIIYFIPDTSSTEYVLYDFNLTLGDTIIHPFGGAVCSNDTVVIIAEDSVLLSDGYHRQLILNTPYVPWIEGVGSMVYLLSPAQVLCVSGNDILQCMNSDSAVSYPSTSTSCLVSVSEQIGIIDKVSISPNPSNGSFIVDFDQSIKEIWLTDLFGNIILKHQTNHQIQFKIDNLSSGTYILTVINRDGRTTNKKIISCP